MKFDIKNINLSRQGKKRILWADNDMPVLSQIRKKFIKEKPLKGLKISGCLHITAETANLARTLKRGGADVVLCASNPLSTQDDVAASLVRDYKIPIFAIKGESRNVFYKHIKAAINHKPNITMDDGADLVSTIHKKFPQLCEQVIASMEETTTGVIRLRAMARDGALKIPVIAVNDAKTKNLFDNRYGTGQSTLDGIIRATDILIAGKTIVISGYGWCGRGLAMRARGMGAKVVITEIDSIKALEAAMDGFQVTSMIKASKIGDLFCTLTGNINVIDKQHFNLMKHSATVCNSGHFDCEVNIKALKQMAVKVRKNVRNFVDEYTIKDTKGKIKKIYLLAKGRLINLAAAEGHPASVMDMSFSTQALVSEWVVKNKHKLEPRVYDVSAKIEKQVAKLKLKSMNIAIDKLTKEQKKYLKNWEQGT